MSKPKWFDRADKVHQQTSEKLRHSPAYKSSTDLMFIALSFAGEAGEAANEIKKYIRGDFKSFDEFRQKLKLELGDVYLFLQLIAHAIDIDLDEAVEEKQPEAEARLRAKGLIK